MAKHTQAHLSRSIPKTSSSGMKDMTRRQMEYYMGAKLLEIGVAPQSAVYRWSSEIKGNDLVMTCSAYWGESREKLAE